MFNFPIDKQIYTMAIDIWIVEQWSGQEKHQSEKRAH